MRVHFIDSQTQRVLNTVEQDELTCPFEGQYARAATESSDIGDLWDGEKYVKPA